MKIQKIKMAVLTLLGLIMAAAFADRALANGGATLSWVAPTTNEDGSTPIDLTGYRIYYRTSNINCNNWDNGDQSYRQANPLSLTNVDISEFATLKDSGDSTASARGYTFSNTNLLNVGATYYFAVVAFDGSGNLSKCTTDTPGGAAVIANKQIFYSGDLNNSGNVSLSDVSILAADFGKNNFCRIAGHASDIDGDCKVSLSDVKIMANDFGK